MFVSFGLPSAQHCLLDASSSSRSIAKCSQGARFGTRDSGLDSGFGLREAGSGKRRDTRAHQNRLAGAPCGGADEYAIGDRHTPMMNSRLTGVAATPSDAGP
jgi:hypothetical protein